MNKIILEKIIFLIKKYLSFSDCFILFFNRNLKDFILNLLCISFLTNFMPSFYYKLQNLLIYF